MITMGSLQLLLISATGSVATAHPIPSIAKGYGGTPFTISKKELKDLLLSHCIKLLQILLRTLFS